MEPAGLAIVARDVFPKGGQSWVLGLSIQKDGIPSVSGHDRHCQVRVNLKAHRDSHHSFDVYAQWELYLAGGKSFQSSIWRVYSEVRVEWVPFYPYMELDGQITGTGDLIRASFLPTDVLYSVLKL